MAFFTTLYMCDMDLVITVHADDPATNGDKPSAGRLLTVKFVIVSLQFFVD